MLALDLLGKGLFNNKKKAKLISFVNNYACFMNGQQSDVLVSV